MTSTFTTSRNPSHTCRQAECGGKMAERRTSLRLLHLLLPSITSKKKKTNAENCRQYRQRVQADPARLASFKETKLKAQKRWLSSRTEEQIQRDRENCKLRKRKERACKSQKKPAKTASADRRRRPLTDRKPLTNKKLTPKEKMELEEKRAKQNQRQQKRRASMTPGQKEQEREKNRLRYHQKKTKLLNSRGIPNIDKKIKQELDDRLD